MSRYRSPVRYVQDLYQVLDHGMLYADDAGIVSRSPNGLGRMMTVIETAGAAFGLTVSEAKTERMCPQTKDGGNVPFTFTAAGQVYKLSTGFVYLGGLSA